MDQGAPSRQAEADHPLATLIRPVGTTRRFGLIRRESRRARLLVGEDEEAGDEIGACNWIKCTEK